MKKVLKTLKNSRCLLGILAFLCYGQIAMAQNQKQTIKGTVTDTRDKGPVIGAVVRIDDTSIATLTDVNGAYIISADLKNGSYTLSFSFTGYKTITKKIELNGGAVTSSAEMSEDALNLNEVVVTGTSVATSKKELGNAISTVSGKDLKGAPATSIDQALAGKVSGAQISQNSGNPAGGISVRLRGNSTISGSSDPLYIVDGVIINNSSDELLDLGGYTQNRLVDINPNDIDHIEIIKGAAAAAIYGSRASNGVVQIFTKKGNSGAPVINISTQFRTSSIVKELSYNKYPSAFVNTNVNDLTQVPVQRYDLQSMIFDQASGTENNMSISGGSDKTQYYISAGYLGNEGIVKTTDFQRVTGRVRVDQRFNDYIKATVGLSYSLSGSQEIPNGGVTNEQWGPLDGFIFGSNAISPYPDPVSGKYPSLSPANLPTTNPLEAFEKFDFRQKTSRVIGSINLNITPVKNLAINYTLGYDNSTLLSTAFIPVENTTPKYNTGYSRRADKIALLLNNDLNVSYKAKIGSFLESTTSAGATAQTEQVNQSSITGTQLTPVSQVSSGAATINSSEFRSTLNILGFYAQQTFGFKDKLYLTGALRTDVASSFGEADRWQYYPKLSGTYLLSEEGFWKNSSLASIMPDFKIRASYGQSGNLTAIGAYDRITSYNNAPLSGLPGVSSPSKLGNAAIKPERQTEREIGMDASFLNNRLGFEFSYYQKDVKDLLLLVDLRPTIGYLTQYQNIGNMTNKGLEVLLRGVPVQNANFKWSATAIFSHNKNKVYDIPGGLLTFPGGFGQVAAVDGYPLGAFYATYFARNTDGSYLLDSRGIPQSEKAGRDVNGQPTGATLSKVIGDPNPQWTASLTNEFSVGKNFSFRMQWDASYGNEIFNFTKRVGDRDIYGGLEGAEAELRGDAPKGSSAKLYNIMENWIEDGSYVKLRELSASYDLRLKFLNNKPLRVTLSGRNLLTISKYSGWDPETNTAGQSNAVRGFDFVEVPIPRTIAVGLNYTF